MLFFNPVPLMKLVEVVSGLQTDAAVAAAIFELAKAWGKTPVHATSTPGFIVNRIARPHYAETLALLLERAATPAVADACLRGAGFRLGPCELMDLIGHDTNFAVTNSVFEADFQDKRYMPSLVQAEMVAGGLGERAVSTAPAHAGAQRGDACRSGVRRKAGEHASTPLGARPPGAGFSPATGSCARCGFPPSRRRPNSGCGSRAAPSPGGPARAGTSAPRGWWRRS